MSQFESDSSQQPESPVIDWVELTSEPSERWVYDPAKVDWVEAAPGQPVIPVISEASLLAGAADFGGEDESRQAAATRLVRALLNCGYAEPFRRPVSGIDKIRAYLAAYHGEAGALVGLKADKAHELAQDQKLLQQLPNVGPLGASFLVEFCQDLKHKL